MKTSFYDMSRRGKLLFTGPQALWFLDQLVTNKVVELPDGEGADALLLSPKGKIEAVMRVLHLDQQVFVDLDAIAAAPVDEFFSGRVFATKVQVRDVTQEYGMVRVIGPDAGELLEKVIQLRDRREGEHFCASFPEGLVAALTRPAPGFDVWTRSGFAGELARRLGAAGASALSGSQYENVRVAGGVPLYGRDLDGSFLPQEAAMEFAVHFQKGCYLGQEAVAMAQRGRVKRRLRHVIFEGEPVLGSIEHDGADGGSVTSIGTVDGRGWGIGVVKTAVEEGQQVTVVGPEGQQAGAVTRELPGTTHGPKVPSARELRERLKG